MTAKKKSSLLAILVAILLVFAMMPLTMDKAHAEPSITFGGVVYTPNADGKTAAVTGYDTTDPPSTVTIQSSVGDGGKYTVTSIGARAFRNYAGLESITISASVTSIGNLAFYNSGLKTVQFANGSGIESIGADAFKGCSSLTSITIPASVESIGGGAFYNSGLTTVMFADNSALQSIGANTFAECSRLTSITIPASVTSIGQDAFYNSGLITVEFANGSGLESIGYEAFKGCSSLGSITIPASVISIGQDAFSGCSGLGAIMIPASVTSIGMGAFYGCTSLAIVHYAGTADEWTNMPNRDQNWAPSNPAVHFVSETITTKATLTADGTVAYICGEAGCHDWRGIIRVIRSPASFELSQTIFPYSGGENEPVVTVTDSGGMTIDPSNYDVTYANNINVGTATAKVRFKEPYYEGEKELSFTIKEAITEAILSSTSYTYNGQVQKPTVTVKSGDKTLTENTDYTATWSNASSKKAGTYTVTITGKGDYAGTIDATYTIDKADITDAEVVLSKTVYTYNGQMQKPSVTVKSGDKTLTAGTDYAATWSNASSKNTGTYTVTITGKGNCTGTTKATYKINKAAITNAKVVLSKTAYTYNGKVQKPTIKTIGGKTLTAGTDYTATWSNASPKKAGTYTVTITGKGNYTGTTKATYKINKAANPLAMKGKTATVKYKKLKKKAQTLAVKKVITFEKNGQGKMTYTLYSAKKKGKNFKKSFKVNANTGSVKIKKKLKKGTYNVTVKVKAAGNANYKASTVKTVAFKVKIK